LHSFFLPIRPAAGLYFLIAGLNEIDKPPPAVRLSCVDGKAKFLQRDVGRQLARLPSMAIWNRSGSISVASVPSGRMTQTGRLSAGFSE